VLIAAPSMAVVALAVFFHFGKHFAGAPFGSQTNLGGVDFKDTVLNQPPRSEKLARACTRLSPPLQAISKIYSRKRNTCHSQ
jgi:hypothetical protein